MNQNLMQTIRKINKIVAAVDSIDDPKFDHVEVDEVNDLAHDVAPRPAPRTRFDYFNSVDAVQAVFCADGVTPISLFDNEKRRWRCMLSNSNGKMDEFGEGPTEASARLSAYLKIRKNVLNGN